MMMRERMNRRRFIAAAAGAVAAPRTAGAQQPGKVYRLAMLGAVGPVSEMTANRSAKWKVFFEDLQRLGYVEGRNLAVERRSAEGVTARGPALARELVALKPDAIYALDNRSTAAFRAATATIPIVAIVADPVGTGFAASLPRPGGNITGFSISAGTEIIGKHIALLKEVVPAASRMACLASQWFWESNFAALYREAAERAGIAMVAAVLEPPAGAAEYRRVFATMVRDRVDSLLVVPAPENIAQRSLIAELVAEARLPAIYGDRAHAEAGGLMAYSIDWAALYRGAADYIGRVLRGADPAELPFQQPTRFELVLNLKTAKALGLTFPPSILVRADEVIE
jgi:putative ABC transport system substrate-binding protein